MHIQMHTLILWAYMVMAVWMKVWFGGAIDECLSCCCLVVCTMDYGLIGIC